MEDDQILKDDLILKAVSDFFLSHFGYIFPAIDQPIFAKVPHNVELGAILEEQDAKDHSKSFVVKRG